MTKMKMKTPNLPFSRPPRCRRQARCGMFSNAEAQRRREAEELRVRASCRRRRISPISNLLSPISYLRAKRAVRNVSALGRQTVSVRGRRGRAGETPYRQRGTSPRPGLPAERGRSRDARGIPRGSGGSSWRDSGG